MRFKTLGADKANRGFDLVSFAVAVKRGQPVCLRADGTGDGCVVTLPSSADAARAHSLLYGIAMADYAASEIGQVQMFGVCEGAVSYRQTRAASTDSYASASSIPSYGIFTIQTALNCISNIGTKGGPGTTTDGNTVQPATIVALASYASAASLPSSDVTGPASTATAIPTYIKSFLRLM